MAAQVVRVELLGPVRAWRGDTELDLGSARRRAVLAMLAVAPGRAVSREELVAGVWGEEPPAAAESSLYTYVSGLRRVLDPARSRWSAGDVLVTAGAGYALRGEAVDCDVSRFTGLRAEARCLAECGNHRAALAAAVAALDLWRGEALSGLSGPFAEQHRSRLVELRLATHEHQAELLLALGRAPEAAALLDDLLRAHPLRESLGQLLMLARYRAGRPAEALAVYRDIRSTLVETLGIEPGPALQALHERVLTADPALLSPKPAPPAPVPTRLPPVPAGFVARHGESAVLTRHLEALREGRGGVVWVEGEPGIGKTALLASALAPAAARGVPVLWGTADEPTSRFPLRVLLDAVRLSEDPSPDQPDSVVRTADGLLNTVARLCAGTPLVLVVDDLHHADQASLVLWHRLTRLTARSPLLLVVATRAVPRGHALTRVRQACLRAGVTLLPVGALSPDESADLVARMVNAEPGLTLLERTRQAAGNPRYLRDVAELLLRQGSVQVEGGIAEVTRRRDRPLGPVIVRRLSFLTDGTRDLLRSATLLGREFELGELAVLTGRTVTELEPPLEEATATGLLELAGPRFAFRYEVVRTALYETMPVTLRQVLHRQAAQHFDEAGIRVERVVAQLLAADGPVDEWVIDWLLAHTATIAGSQPADTVTLLTRVVASPALRGPLRETLTARLVRLRLLLGGRPEAEARAVLATTSEESVAEEMRRVLAELARPALSDRCQNP